MKQVSEWLGHADPAFTMRVYISLLDEGLGDGLELTPTPSETSLLHGVIPSVDPDASAAA